jgi:hypothetical protein
MEIHHYVGRTPHFQPRQFTIDFSTLRFQLTLLDVLPASESVIFRAMLSDAKEILFAQEDEA